MIVARVEFFASTPMAPTRRLALGRSELPADPAPGYGGALLGGVAARFAGQLTDEQRADLDDLIDDLFAERRIVQPRARYRLQSDRVGLRRCRHHLVADGSELAFRFDADRAHPVQHLLGAIYAAASAGSTLLIQCVQAGLEWDRPPDRRFIAALASGSVSAGLGVDRVGWARGVLRLDGRVVERRDVQRAFREQLRSVHPDHGADGMGAADRIAELNEARRILLAAS